MWKYNSLKYLHCIIEIQIADTHDVLFCNTEHKKYT